MSGINSSNNSLKNSASLSGSCFLKRADAGIKLLAALFFVIVILLANNVVLSISIAIIALTLARIHGMTIRFGITRLAGPLGMSFVIGVIQMLSFGSREVSGSFLGLGLHVTLEGAQGCMLLCSRVFGATCVVILLGVTTPARELFRGMARLRVPTTWIELAQLTYRYIFVLMEEAISVKDAQRLRLGYSGLARSLSSVGVLAGSVVVRSMDQAFRSHEAMILRGTTMEETMNDQSQNGSGLLSVIEPSSIALEACSISFSYDDGSRVIRDLSLKINKGSFVAMLASNGSGKTTLLKLFAGLLKPQLGQIMLQGISLKDLKPGQIYRQLGLVLQNPNDQLFESTVEDDVAYGPRNLRLSQEEIDIGVSFALEVVGAAHLRNRQIQSLSFGEQKRIAIAGVLSMAQNTLLLDEPTTGLDPAGELQMMALLQKLNKERGLTIVMATHAVDMLPLFADRICVLHKGELVKEGRIEEVFREVEALKKSDLRLPYVGALMHELMGEMKLRKGIDIGEPALTVRHAREQILELMAKAGLG